MLTVLHTSDWHLGHQLHRKRRDEEFAAFLEWLVGIIESQSIDVVIVAGDVFDTPYPGAVAQKQYYDFLLNAAKAGARHIVITAGNHDSPAFLGASRQLLRRLHIHVVAEISENPEDEILLLNDANGQPELIVCGVPYLREKDAREAAPGESIADKERKLIEGIGAHYAKIANLAQNRRDALGAKIPIIATGHLFTTNAIAGDGVRDLYIGSLGHVPAEIFSPAFDYVALGHIHKPQKIGDSHTRRYSGSPVPMGFNEVDTKKELVTIRFNADDVQVQTVPVPVFRRLESIRGTRNIILNRLRQLVASHSGPPNAWVELRLEGGETAGDLYHAALELTRDSNVEILRVSAGNQASSPEFADDCRGLEDFAPEDMFAKLLATQNGTPERNQAQMAAFQELLAIWRENRRNGEKDDAHS